MARAFVSWLRPAFRLATGLLVTTFLGIAACPVDEDGDGFTSPEDCDDQDPATYPGALEVCDTSDNDCDGQVNEDLNAIWFPDADQDGFGVEASSLVTCEIPPGPYSSARGDCDDADASIHPGAEDTIGDKVDRDCGGTDGPSPNVGFEGSAYTRIQAAILAASNGETVWVGPGTYLESDISFRGKAIRLASTHLAEATIIDAKSNGRVFVFDSGETAESALDGFTLTGGFSRDDGGGMYAYGSSPTIRDCIFSGNVANMDGGGVYIEESAATFEGCLFSGNRTTNEGGGAFVGLSDAAVFSHCTFTGNEANNGGGARIWAADALFHYCRFTDNVVAAGGGGVYHFGGMPVYEHCVFTGNTASTGGALDSFSAEPILRHCLISDNYAEDHGGGIDLEDSAITLDRCVLAHNRVTGNGGGMYIYTSSPRITHTVIHSNEALLNGAGMFVDWFSFPEIDHTILAYNDGDQLFQNAGSSTLTYTDLYSARGPSHNLDELDPTNLVVEPGFLTYDADGLPLDLHLATDSPLVDAGSPDLALEDVDGSQADIGLYGGAEGNSFDRDEDGVPDYFWPGRLEDAPAGFDTAGYDCDDENPFVQGCP